MVDVKLEEWTKQQSTVAIKATGRTFQFQPGPNSLRWRPMNIEYKVSPRRKSFPRSRFRGRPEMTLEISGILPKTKWFELYGLMFYGYDWDTKAWDDGSGKANPDKKFREAIWRLIAPPFVPGQQADGSAPTAGTNIGDDIFLVFDQISELEWLPGGISTIGNPALGPVSTLANREYGYRYTILMNRVTRV